MSPTLSIVASNATAEGRAETLAERIRRLQAEARSLAREHVAALQGALGALQETAAAIAQGGEAYPPGVREVARRLAEDCEARVQTLDAIANRG